MRFVFRLTIANLPIVISFRNMVRLWALKMLAVMPTWPWKALRKKLDLAVQLGLCHGGDKGMTFFTFGFMVYLNYWNLPSTSILYILLLSLSWFIPREALTYWTSHCTLRTASFIPIFMLSFQIVTYTCLFQARILSL